MQLTAKAISDAIRAYQSGESAVSIEKRTGLRNQTLCANMRADSLMRAFNLKEALRLSG